ncbi:MAG: flagellar hook basal-body protein, partial [Pseudomonadota bacterium]
MTLFASLKVSTLGLNAQGTKMGAISDNIANVNTVGYKRTDVQFSTLVTERIRETRFTPGGVTARPRQTVDQAGQLLGTGISTDFAVSGRGMFIVSEEATFSASTSDDGLAYTRAGSFRADSDGFLVNTAGYYLQGWTVNRNGEVTLDGTDASTIIDSPTFTDLQPVNVNRFSNIAEQTENQRIRANLPNDFTTSQALERDQVDPNNPFSLSVNAGVAAQLLDGTGTNAFTSTDTVVNPTTADGQVDIAFTVTTADGTTETVTIDGATLLANGFDPVVANGNNTIADFVGAISASSTTLTNGDTVTFSASLSANGVLQLSAIAGPNDSVADVTAVVFTDVGTAGATAIQFSNAAGALDLQPRAQSSSITINAQDGVLADTPLELDDIVTEVGAAGAVDVFTLVIDNEEVDFDLNTVGFDSSTGAQTVESLITAL